MKRINFTTTNLLIVIVLTFLSLTNIAVSADKTQDITIQLPWVYQGNYSGPLVAADKKLFPGNIRVQIQPGGQNITPTNVVKTGKAQFGITGPDQILLARQMGVPLVATALIFRKHVVCFITMKNSGISTPSDFIGKTVGVHESTIVSTVYNAMMAHLGINRNGIKEVVTPWDMGPFFRGDFQVWPAFIFNEPYLARSKGFEINIINPIDYGVDMYGEVLFTTEAFIRENPDVVRAVTKGVVDGWNEVRENPEAGLNAVLSRDKTADSGHQKYIIKESLKLIYPDGIQPGPMNDDGWGKVRNVLYLSGVAKKGSIDISGAYSNMCFPNN